MFIMFIILTVIALAVLLAMALDGSEPDEVIAALLVFGAILIIPFFMTFRWQVSDNVYTGYVYSRDSSFGYTSYHIRFSQNAGEDSQPSFTVKAGSDEEKKLDSLVGTDTKVKIKVPSASPKFVNNIFEPSSFAEIVEEK